MTSLLQKVLPCQNNVYLPSCWSGRSAVGLRAPLPQAFPSPASARCPSFATSAWGRAALGPWGVEPGARPTRWWVTWERRQQRRTLSEQQNGPNTSPTLSNGSNCCGTDGQLWLGSGFPFSWLATRPLHCGNFKPAEEPSHFGRSPHAVSLGFSCLCLL